MQSNTQVKTHIMKTMNKKIISKVVVIGCVAVLTLSACSPRVMTEVTTHYLSRSVDEVTVFDVGDTVPNNSMALGRVAVLDRGFTTNCEYDRMLSLAKEKTAETGGNGLLLTVHTEPKTSGSNCHQLMGTMFLMKDMTIDPAKPNPVMESAKSEAEKIAQKIKDRTMLSNSVRLSVGYAKITSDIETFKGIKHPSGVELTLDYEHRWRSGFGFGLNTALFRSSYSKEDDGADGHLALFYMGPSLLYAFKFHKHWALGWNLGVGCVYADDVPGQQTGIGFMGKMRLEYLVNENWGVGFDVNGITSTLKKPDGVQLRDGEKWGYGRVNYMLGLRYYF